MIFLPPLQNIDVSSLFKMYIRVCFYIDNKYCLQLKFLCRWYCSNILYEKKCFAGTKIKLMGSTHIFTQVFVPSFTLSVPAGCGGATSMSVCRCPYFGSAGFRHGHHINLLFGVESLYNFSLFVPWLLIFYWSTDYWILLHSLYTKNTYTQ